MRPPINHNTWHDFARQEPEHESRRHGRLRAELLHCKQLGEVLDLSASGMRVLVKGGCQAKVDDLLSTELEFEKIRLPIQARITWVQRVGFRRHHVGLEFVNLTPELVEGLRSLARSAVAALDPQFHG